MIHEKTRIQIVGDQYWMTIKQLDEDSSPFDDSMGLKLSTTRPFNVNEWAQFKYLLSRTNFWSMPRPDVNGPGLDGFSFTLEGRQAGRYHVVYRWVPDDENFTEACIYPVDISKLTWRQQ